MSEWREGIWIALSAILVTIFFIFMGVVRASVGEATRLEQDRINQVEAAREYYGIGRYNDAIVNYSDVINCIQDNKTKTPSVIVSASIYSDSPTGPILTVPGSGCFSDANMPFGIDLKAAFITSHTWNITNPYYQWDGANPTADYADKMLEDYVPINAKYRANLVKNANGEVIYIWFRRIA